MKASDIRNLVFSRSPVGGYKVADVRSCLNEISDYVLNLEEKNAVLEKENRALQTRLSEVDKTQDEIKDVMISAQNFKHKLLKETEDKTSELVIQANEKAKNIEMTAKKKCSDMIEEANARVEQKKAQLEVIKNEVSAFKVKLLELYKSHLDLITKIPEVAGAKQKKQVNLVESKSNHEDNSLGEDVFSGEDESEVFESLQKNKDVEDLGFESEEFSKVKRNISDDENIFQKGRSNDPDKEFMKELKKNDNYIKSRFDELSR